MHVEDADRRHYRELIQIWEASVRATHNFLDEKDIASLKPLILEHCFDAVDLKCIRNPHGEIIAFSGIYGDRIEMLFVSPIYRGMGIGSFLCRHAIEGQGANKVDVNEQNPQAIGFYEHLGFEITGRSPLDGQGNPFPLLHMELRQ